MKRFTALFVAVSIAFGVMLTGCWGGGAELKSDTKTTTIGQELIDLDKAHAQGIITDDEYKDLKKKIIKGR